MAGFRATVLKVVSTGLALTACGCQNQKYEWGRDTVDSFGNGRFQIARSPTRLVLSDREGGIVVDRVKNWRTTSGYVYVVDHAGKCWKVDYRTGEVLSFERLDVSAAGDRAVFEKLLE